jgi:hypothetical protein
MGGFFDFIGGSVDTATTTGAFDPGDLKRLGAGAADVLQERLRPVEEQPDFLRNLATIRDALGISTRGSLQQFGEAAQRGGFSDSGAVAEGRLGLARGEQLAMAQQTTQLINAMEARRLSDVFPFLGLAVQENLGVSGQNIQAATAQRGQNLGFLGDISGSLIGGKGLPGFLP